MDIEKIDALRSFLADHVGKTLTPEMCHTVDRIARFEPDRSVDLSQFEPCTYQGFEIGVERFSPLIEELEPLHTAHWLETEKHRHGLTLNPDYPTLRARERAGRLVQFTLRNGAGLLAGHLRMYTGISTHTSTVFAEEDTLYIRPEFRGGFVVMALIRYAETCLRRLGAREIRVDSKLLNKADVLMKRMGYTPYALKFVKFFED